MVVRNIVKRNFFRDSLQLMHISEKAKKLKGLMDAAVVMGTKTNKEILEKLGLLLDEGRNATESDMVIAVAAETDEHALKAVEEIEKMLVQVSEAAEEYFFTVDSALESIPDANLAVVSIPGEYAKDVVLKLLDKGLHVHLFSDHVPIEHELEIKEYARERGLLVMGPAAGTSIINNRAIAFANVLERGPIGIVAAAGTGLQEVSVLISLAGSGVSQGIGIGGGDVKSKVGGIMALEAIKALEKDPETKVVAIVSKPPDPDVQGKLFNFIAEETVKRYVTCFIGGKPFEIPGKLSDRLSQTMTLHSAALEAVKLVDEKIYVEAKKKLSIEPGKLVKMAEEKLSGLMDKQKYIRGLFTGGTLTYESLVLLSEVLGGIYSNTPLQPRFKLKDPYKSFKHSVVDLGEEEFTVGRAHPMIDPTIRNLRLVEEARDPEVAVIMMDFILGYGSHPDPADAHAEAIRKAVEIAERDGRKIVFLGHVCGTDSDPQSLTNQVNKLRKLGVQVLPTNALMVLLASLIAARKLEIGEVEKIYMKYLSPL